MIGGVSAVVRWIVTAQEPPLALLVIVQLGHGLTFGMTIVGTMNLLVQRVPSHQIARGQGYYAACNGLLGASDIDRIRCDLRPHRRQPVLRDGRDGRSRRAGDLVGAASTPGSSPERGVRRIDQTVVVAQPVLAVAREQ